MRVMPLILALSCLLLATACDEETPSGPTVSLNQEFTLSPGETAAVKDSSLRVQFARVTEDSRCPRDAACVWAGDALVEVRAGDDRMAEYVLHTGDEPRAAAHAGFRIELVNLQPYPLSTSTIRPEDYRAILRVSRP